MGRPRTCLDMPAVDILKVTQQRQKWYIADANWGGGAHWHPLANTTEPSVCGGDAALCQITVIGSNKNRMLSASSLSG